MALKQTLTLALALLSSAAYGDCASDARRAREAVLTSGPFQYRSRVWNKYSDWLKIGFIEPNKAEHILEWTMDTPGRHRTREEQITIGQQGWAKDSFGWRSSSPEFLPHELAIPQSPYEASNTKCLGRVEVDGKSLIGYEQNAKILDWNFVEKIFADPDSRLTVRYERIYVPGTASSGYGTLDSVTSTYRYDASIKIEPPKVDLAERQAKSHQAFQHDVDSSDPACRQEVMEIINRGQTASPFQYKIIAMSGLRKMRGVFVPPRSYHVIDETYFMNAGGEGIHIDDRAWRCTRKSGWEEYKMPLAGMSAKYSFLDFISVSDQVGGAKCFGDTYVENALFYLYEYNVYTGLPERHLISKWQMYVAMPSNLPTIFDELDNSSGASAKITRTYDKNIAITPPAGACSFPIINEKF
jgi:hypothetical protein